MTRLAVSVVAFAALGLVSASAHADPCPAPLDAPALAGVDTDVRLAYLARAFDLEVSEIDTWSWSWGSVYAAGTVAEAVAVPLTADHGKRIGYEVGAVSTAFGAVSLLGLPLQLTLPMRSARSHWSDADKCATLARAERTLVSVEGDQRLSTGVVPHLGNVAVNVGIALILGLGYDQWASAAISFGVGVVVGEANAFTQPHHLRDVLARYRSGQLVTPSPPVTWFIAPVHTREMTGAAFTVLW